MVKIKDFEMGDFPEFSGWPQSYHCVFKSRRKSKKQKSVQERWEELDPFFVGVEDGEGGYEPRNVVTSRNWTQSSADS